MFRFLFVFCAVACASLCTDLTVTPAFAQTSPFAFPPSANAEEAIRLAFYDYDKNLPLKTLEQKLPDANERRTRTLVGYDSVHDQRVSAIIAVPKGFTAPYPAVILVHGSGGNKDTSYIGWISEMLLKQGFLTISIDTQYHGDRARPGRSGEIHMPDSFTMRDGWVQSVVDLRRTVDYLESRPDVDKRKIGYMGFSQGGMLGAVFGGVESRVNAFCLAVPGGGFIDLVNHIDQYPVLKAHWPIERTPEVMKRVVEISNITDPIHFVGRIVPRPLMVIVAKHDEIIPPEASAALVKASGVKEENIKRWESGHILNPNAFFDVMRFFVQTFGKTQTSTK
ncbi:MAG: acetylxylan esterase [Chthonomonadaceae bacterium]|nr:acetylxylan esterase [Chthonomonadaceae bacterium]